MQAAVRWALRRSPEVLNPLFSWILIGSVFVACIETAADLSANQCLVVCSEALAYLRTIEEKFDVVFVDPPFYRGMALSSVELLESIGCLNSNAHVYVEMERGEGLNQLSEQWKILRHYQSGSRSHYLLQFVQN